jgi:hypothetical protein
LPPTWLITLAPNGFSRAKKTTAAGSSGVAAWTKESQQAWREQAQKGSLPPQYDSDFDDKPAAAPADGQVADADSGEDGKGAQSAEEAEQEAAAAIADGDAENEGSDADEKLPYLGPIKPADSAIDNKVLAARNV